MWSENEEISENSYVQRKQQILNDLQRQRQHQPMFHFISVHWQLVIMNSSRNYFKFIINNFFQLYCCIVNAALHIYSKNQFMRHKIICIN